MRVVQGGHFLQFGSIASLATETTDGEHGLRSDLRVSNSQNFPGGTCPQTPHSLFTLKSTRNGRTSLK